MKLVEKLATSSSSLGENINQQNSTSSSASTTGSDGGAPGGANNYFAAAGGTTSRADEQKNNRSPRPRDENGTINQASGGASSSSSAFASLKTRIFLKLLSLGSNTLWLTVVIAGVTFLVMYRLLSFVSKSIVWVWFLCNSSNCSRATRRTKCITNFGMSKQIEVQIPLVMLSRIEGSFLSCRKCICYCFCTSCAEENFLWIVSVRAVLYSAAVLASPRGSERTEKTRDGTAVPVGISK